jgi:hypothetical protein
MVTFLISRSVRRAASRFSVFCNRHSALIETILRGLGMFGLAVNGMCLAAPAHSLPEVSKCGLAVER